MLSLVFLPASLCFSCFRSPIRTLWSRLSLFLLYALLSLRYTRILSCRLCFV
jgi:hypothetical protein